MATDAFAGPVDVVVFGFARGANLDSGLTALLAAVDSGAIEILDLEVISADAAGKWVRLDWAEVLDDASRKVFAGAESDLLDDEDLAGIAASLKPDSFAVVIVYEDRSLAAVAAAWGDAGGELLLSGGVDMTELEGSLASEGAD